MQNFYIQCVLNDKVFNADGGGGRNFWTSPLLRSHAEKKSIYFTKDIRVAHSHGSKKIIKTIMNLRLNCKGSDNSMSTSAFY